MVVLVTLTSPGSDTGPFNLFSSVDLVTPLVSGVAKSALVSGYTLSSVPDAATYIKVASTGTCTNSINLNITNPTSTTTSTTTSGAGTTTTTTTAGGSLTTTTTTTVVGGSTTTTTTVAPSTTTTTTTRLNVNVGMTFQLDAGNTGSMSIYVASPAGSTPVLSTTLSTNGATASVGLFAGDSYYVTVIQTTRASSGQRGQIQDSLNGVPTNYQTGSGSLPQSVSSTPRTVGAGNTYSVLGICGTVV
jgi:hypothetical protein